MRMEVLDHQVRIKDELLPDGNTPVQNSEHSQTENCYPFEDFNSVKAEIVEHGSNVENIIIKPEFDKYDSVQCPLSAEEPIATELSRLSGDVFANGFVALSCSKCNCPLPHNQPNMWSSSDDASINLYCYQCYCLINGSKVLPYGDRSSQSNHVTRRLNIFECCECDRSFNRKYDLMRHIESIHQKLKNFVCDECGFSFTKNSSMQRHVNAVHKKAKNYQCAECTRAFARQGKLVEHIKAVHRKFKRFQCPECLRGLTRKADLLRHIKSKHSPIDDIQVLVL